MKFFLAIIIFVFAIFNLTLAKSKLSSNFQRKTFIYGRIDLVSPNNTTEIDNNSSYLINFKLYDALLVGTDSTVTQKELRNVKVRFPFHYRIKIPRNLLNAEGRYALSVTIREFTNGTLAYLTDTATFLQPRKFKYNLLVIKIN